MRNKSKMSNKIFFLLLFGASLFILYFWTKTHIRINYTDSMLKGIYCVTDKRPANKDIVVVCLPDTIAKFGLLRGYLMSGSCQNGSRPVLKRIIAMKGDLVETQEQGIRINNMVIRESKILSMDSQNRPLTSVLGKTFLLEENQIWLFGENSNYSWDSRCYGPIDIKYVHYVMLPVLTWR